MSIQTEIIITQNILGQIKVELQMDDLCLFKLKKSKSWKKVCRFLEGYQSPSSQKLHKRRNTMEQECKHMNKYGEPPFPNMIKVSEETSEDAKKCAYLSWLNAKKALDGEETIAESI